MPKEDRKEYFRTLGLDNCSSENEIKRAYKKLSLHFHPDKSFGDCSASKFEDIGQAFKVLTSDLENDSLKTDFDKMFFDFFRDILFGRKEGVSIDFLPFFCGSKSHGTSCSRSEGDYEYRCQEGEEDFEIDGEKELDSFIDIMKTRRKHGKSVPPEFCEDKVIVLKDQLVQHKEEMRKDGSKKQASKKGKSSVPITKPKPKSKKELLAEQRRRNKEMQQIAVELEEKRKEEEEKEKQRKQMEVEKQKRVEEERVKAQNEERKRREREQKEREKQQKLDLEKEERRLRQQEEERKRREEEEKRKKAEKEKADKEKAARKAAAQQAAREKEEQTRAANKNLQNNKRQQQQQQRTDQQQYPREIPPRFQKRLKQQQQQQQQQSQMQSLPQSTQPQQSAVVQQQKPSLKPQPAVSKKKDPNRFASKEFAGLVDEIHDGGWAEGPSGKGSGWGNSLESWENDEKWGAVDRQWGGKEGVWDQVVFDETDKDSWPTVGIKGAVGDSGKVVMTTSSEKSKVANVDRTFPTASTSKLSTDSSQNTPGNSHEHKLPNTNSGWQGAVYPSSSENWDIADESVDQAIDAAEAAAKETFGGLGSGWGGAHSGGLGGIIGTSYSTANQKKDASLLPNKPVASDTSNTWENESMALNNSESHGWSKTPGKGPKTKPIGTTSVPSSTTTSLSSSWGGTPADSSSGWSNAPLNSKGSTSEQSKWGTVSSTTGAQSVSTVPKAMDQKSNKTSTKTDLGSGWGDLASTSNWGAAVPSDVTGASCWDNAASSSAMKNEKNDWKTGSDKVTGWLDSAGNTPDIVGSDWGQTRDQDEGSEGSWDGWTTASKRNKVPKSASAQDCNVWFSRSLKKLLDMGFKQEDAEKALKSNHLNIESAIGDLLSLNIAGGEDAVPVVPSMTKEPDPAEAAQIAQQQPKLNRKQRRKLQQQQTEQTKELQPSQANVKQSQTAILQPENSASNFSPLGKSSENTNKSQDNSSVSEQSKESSSVQPKKVEKDSNTKQGNSKQSDSKYNYESSKSSDAPQHQTASKPSTVQGSPNLNNKRVNAGMIPLGVGVQPPIRQPIAHPLLQQQLMQQQLHMQQLRMAQGGLLQPPHLTPQQLVLLQQIAQLQMVQQRLAAQSVAQQHLGQKHGQSGLPMQQQLFQQQQQIALMIAQMQQQVLQQQQPPLAGRFPASSPPTLQQQAQQVAAQQNAASQPQKGSITSKPQQQQQQQQQQSEKAANEQQQNKTEDKPKNQMVTPKETLPQVHVPVSVNSDHTKQPSPAPQSRLQQYKQPLLPEPTNEQSVSSADSLKSSPLSVNTQTSAVTEQWNSPSKSDSSTLLPNSSAATPTTEVQSSGLSPRTRNRIADPVSSRWGVDAGPKLSADPPEFKPGVPWRPRENLPKETREPLSAAPVVGTVPITTASVIAASSATQATSATDTWSKAAFSTVTTSEPTTSTLDKTAVSSNTITPFPEIPMPGSSSFSGQNQLNLGLNSPWQIPGDKSAFSSLPAGAIKTPSSSGVGAGIRPPPGLGSDSPGAEDEQPSWLKNLIGATNDSGKSDFQFSRFGFVVNTPWSHNQEGTQPFGPLNPVPQPWAAPGGPTPSAISSATSAATSMATSGINTNSTPSGPSETSKRSNLGISSWSSTQPIPSAQELNKAAVTSTVGSTPTTLASGNPLKGANPMSTWLVLQNLTPKVDPGQLRTRCQQHGSLLTFQLNLRHGNSLIRYGSKEIAAKARDSLNSAVIGGGPITADFATDADIGSFFEQTMDWSSNPFPANTFGNQWSFQNSPKNPSPNDSTAAAAGSTSASINLQHPGSGEKSAPGMPWGAGGAVPAPSQLWGSSQGPGAVGSRFMAPQGTAGMWSFGAGFSRDVEPQSGSNENGLVSPSMTTFLPPGLLNGGESV